MKHSCGHKAPKDVPRETVRTMPRCTLCADRKEGGPTAASIDSMKLMTKAERDEYVYHALTGD